MPRSIRAKKTQRQPRHASRPLEGFANEKGLNVEFSRLAAAKEYRQTMADLANGSSPADSQDAQPIACDELPTQLFATRN